jgi:hypothetical protein
MDIGLVFVICKKLKSLPGAFSTFRPRGSILFLPQQATAFISRGAMQMRETSTSEGGNYPPNFASGSEFYKNSLGFVYMPQSWDMLFYFPSEGRHTEDFSDARKIQRLRPGLNP